MGWVIITTPLPLSPREWSGNHCTGGWVGPRADLDGCGKSLYSTGIRSPYLQPITSWCRWRFHVTYVRYKFISLCRHHICKVCLTTNIFYISPAQISLVQLDVVVTRVPPWSRTLAETFARPPCCFLMFCQRFPYQNMGLRISPRCVTVHQDPKVRGPMSPTLHKVMPFPLCYWLG